MDEDYPEIDNARERLISIHPDVVPEVKNAVDRMNTLAFEINQKHIQSNRIFLETIRQIAQVHGDEIMHRVCFIHPSGKYLIVSRGEDGPLQN